MPSASPVRRLRWLAFAATATALAAPALAGSQATALARGTTWTAPAANGRLTAATMRNVIVQAKAGHEAAAAAAIRNAGGVVDKDLPVVNGFAAHVPAAALGALRSNAAVRAVTNNDSVQFASNMYDDSTVASSYSKASGASTAWANGNLGEGVGVAVIDTGISPMNDLSGRIVHGPDLSGEGTIIDNYGHGTVMAGIVGGSGADSASRGSGMFAGVAPKSTLVAVKVAGRNGAADVSTLLQAMHWVSAYKDQFNIRVLNLSWGTDSTDDPATDPINYAVERLWRQGIVVVVAAGNSGNANYTITKPGDDPVVLTVGAYNDQGNTDPSDDGIPAWSSRGPTTQGLAKPDLVAPGRTLVATRSYGSYVEQNNPRSLVSPSYIKGSGTSEATAVTSGLAALLLKAHPDWTPDQVKAAFMSSALPMANTGKYAQGKGRIQLDDALVANPGPATQQTFQSTGLGSLESSRGSVHVQVDCQQNGTYTVLQGEYDARCNPWNGSSWTGSSWTGSSWTGSSWTGSSWTGSSWTGSSWTGSSWTGSSWTGSSWTGSSWTSAGYDTDTDFLTAFWGQRPKFGKHVNGEQSEPRGSVNARGDDGA